MSVPPTIAVLLTCFNRVETTIACLTNLHRQQGTDDAFTLVIHLTDDGSTDGTESRVRDEFPAVNILKGDGSLYWVGGMHLADTAAWQARPDYVLWLNDDVELDSDAILRLLDTSAATSPAAIAVGAMCSAETGELSYSGMRRGQSWHPLHFDLVRPSGSPQPVDTMHGNVVLVPAHARAVAGPIDEAYTHTMADLDYGLRSRSLGVEIMLSPDFVGTCEPNVTKETDAGFTGSLRSRLQQASDIKAFPPKEWLTHNRRHAGWLWPATFGWPYVRAIFKLQPRNGEILNRTPQ